MNAPRLLAYLSRLGLEPSLASAPPTAALLATLMAAQSRAIAFENLDVVLRRPVAIGADDVAAKLLGTPRRGGYCFEQNQLLRSALCALGFAVEPLLCRVRWGKAAGEETPFTHVALRVALPASGADYLVDVGFAGTNSIAPLPLGGGSTALPEGSFRALDGATVPGYTTLQLELRGEWRDLYMWRTGEAASTPDLSQANLWSYASPTARFTNEFFLARVVDDARHFIVNDVYRVRAALHGAAAPTEEVVRDAAHLARLLEGVFGLDAPPGLIEAWERTYKRK
jgi:N-hydroxyarylamine O-acetyltransferase